jgi:hypothetical protein
VLREKTAGNTIKKLHLNGGAWLLIVIFVAALVRRRTALSSLTLQKTSLHTYVLATVAAAAVLVCTRELLLMLARGVLPSSSDGSSISSAATDGMWLSLFNFEDITTLVITLSLTATVVAYQWYAIQSVWQPRAVELASAHQHIAQLTQEVESVTERKRSAEDRATLFKGANKVLKEEKRALDNEVEQKARQIHALSKDLATEKAAVRALSDDNGELAFGKKKATFRCPQCKYDVGPGSKLKGHVALMRQNALRMSSRCCCCSGCYYSSKDWQYCMLQHAVQLLYYYAQAVVVC